MEYVKNKDLKRALKESKEKGELTQEAIKIKLSKKPQLLKLPKKERSFQKIIRMLILREHRVTQERMVRNS